jgi:PAS domain S-box-containing protein
MKGVEVGELIGRATGRCPEILPFALSFSAPGALDAEVLAGVTAGARCVLPAHQTEALSVLMERALREVEERRGLGRRNDLLLAAAGEGIYGLDLQGRTTFINPAAARMIDWPVEELLGKPQHAILHHSHADGSPYPREECPIYAAFTDGAVHDVEDEVFWRKDGTSFPVEYVSTPMREDGRVVGAVVVFRDVSRRRELERALAENVRHLEQTQAELTSALEQLLSTEDLALAAQQMGASVREILAVVERLRDDTARDADGRRDLDSLCSMLSALEYLARDPAPPPAPRLDVGKAVSAALNDVASSGGAKLLAADTNVGAAGSHEDLQALVRLLSACAGPGAEVRVWDEEGTPSVSFRGRRGPRKEADRLSFLFARRLAGRSLGAIETRHEPGDRITFILRLAPAAS